MNKTFFKLLKVVAFVALAIYVGICVILYISQDKLLFHPKPTNTSQVAKIIAAHPQFDTVTFIMNDGNRTCGFISTNTASIKRPLILYFGGNAEEVSHLMDYSKYFPNSVLALINYRSFGLSEGNISEKTMFSDALEVYDQLLNNAKVDANKVIVIGRSIGTGVATYLSSQRKTTATVLITPYENMIEVALEKYPFAPIGLLINHRFESDKYAKGITSPMLALIASEDRVIPKHHAYLLIEAWKGPTTALEVNEDHSSIMKNEQVWEKIATYVKDKIHSN